MSGRKSGEVANVLNQTQDIQNTIFNSYEKEINHTIEDINESGDSINTNQNNISRFQVKDFEDIKKELPSEAKNIEKSVESIKYSAKNLHSEDASKFELRLANVKSKITSLNQQANQIRDAIRRSYDYMDSEYAKAKAVKKQMITLKEEFRKLKSQVNSAKNSNLKIDEQMASKSTLLDGIGKEILALDKKAKNIKHIRNEATALKLSITEDMKSIDKAKAEKFAKTKYNKIEKNSQTLLSASNEVVIQNYSALSASITSLKAQYTQDYNEWLANKTYSEKLLKSIGEQGDASELILMEDMVNDIDKTVSKFEYHDNYKGTKTKNEFHKLRDEAVKLFDDEEFQKCNSLLEDAKLFYEKISNETDNMRENIEASANLAFKIREIMLSDKINFTKAHLEIIDDNPLNGFRLECQNGDTINFEEINFDSDGNVVIDLDHIENTGGTCGVRWGQMKQVFNDEGIPLADVKKDGNSVIYRDVSKKTTNSQQRKRG